MQLSAACLLRRVLPVLCAVGLTGCPVRPPGSPTALEPAHAAVHVGTPYAIQAAESVLMIRAYKGGTLAAAGHNHIIASHELSGTIYVSADVLKTSFEVHVPVVTLSVDEHDLRLQQASADFPPDVPDSAKEGTRRNMLGAALLDADDYPEIVLSAVRVEDTPSAGTVLVRIQALVRGTPHEFSVPVRYERSAATVTASGETALRQSDLGLKPFSALLGALQVQDEMRISFHIVAHADITAPQR
jgi:polyisoprenoid-binding protein YceI